MIVLSLRWLKNANSLIFKILCLFAAAFFLNLTPWQGGSEAVFPNQKLSDYNFFDGEIKNLSPGENTHAYEVNAPLFSDYAEKERFVHLPPGSKMTFSEKGYFELPVGAAIIKNFYYPNDQRSPEKGRKLLETRLLVREEKGWKALEYLWNAEQTDAFLEVAGASFPVSWIGADGKKHEIEYIAPNLNQCKGCHSQDGKFVPIGLTARQLNRPGKNPQLVENQLIDWNSKALFNNFPENASPEKLPRLADYLDEKTGNLEARARAYLDANCGHCHNARGPASTSGMFLDIFESNPERLGIGKPPVAAGRGSGKREFGIVPGKPDKSILVFRMENNDPGIRMPELGRQTAHREGVELIRNWIKNL